MVVSLNFGSQPRLAQNICHDILQPFSLIITPSDLHNAYVISPFSPPVYRVSSIRHDILQPFILHCVRYEILQLCSLALQNKCTIASSSLAAGQLLSCIVHQRRPRPSQIHTLCRRKRTPFENVALRPHYSFGFSITFDSLPAHSASVKSATRSVPINL